MKAGPHTYHFPAVFYPVRSDEISFHVQENTPVFFVDGRCYELKRVFIDGREERGVGVLRTIAGKTVWGKILYESQFYGVIFVEADKKIDQIVFGKETKELSDANFVS